MHWPLSHGFGAAMSSMLRRSVTISPAVFMCKLCVPRLVRGEMSWRNLSSLYVIKSRVALFGISPPLSLGFPHVGQPPYGGYISDGRAYSRSSWYDFFASYQSHAVLVFGDRHLG